MNKHYRQGDVLLVERTRRKPTGPEVASTWRKPDGSMMFAKPDDYAPDLET